MAKQSNKKSAQQMKNVSSMIKEAIYSNGYKDVKECARSIKVPYDLFNKVVGGHIPKDSQLLDYAKKLDIDPRELIMAAYREKAPDIMKPYFNSVMLIEDHKTPVQEVLDMMDSFNTDQMDEFRQVATLIQGSPRSYCRKAVALLSLYQELDNELMDYFDALILLALRGDNLKGLKEFKETVEAEKAEPGGRRKRLHT